MNPLKMPSQHSAYKNKTITKFQHIAQFAAAHENGWKYRRLISRRLRFPFPPLLTRSRPLLTHGTKPKVLEAASEERVKNVGQRFRESTLFLNRQCGHQCINFQFI
jgi:hypothetical protein